MKTGLTKKQKVTEVYYNAKDPTAEVYTHDTKLKKRLNSRYIQTMGIFGYGVQNHNYRMSYAHGEKYFKI